MLASIPSATLLGVDGHPVTVEVHATVGLPGFTIVGLPDTACRESATEFAPRSRRQASAGRIGRSPSTSRHPGCARSEPASISPSRSAARGRGRHGARRGRRRTGVHRRARSRRNHPPRARRALARRRARRASCRRRTQRLSRGDACCRVAGRSWRRGSASSFDALIGVQPWPSPPPPPDSPPVEPAPDLADVRGQPVARFALEVAAAGNHHALFVGPPGAGKTMLARRLPALLPAARRRPRPRIDTCALRRGCRSSRGARAATAVSFSAPRCFERLVGRRWEQRNPAGRGQPRSRRGALPRRAGRVPAGGARRAAAATRRRCHSRRAGGGSGRAPGAVPSRRGDEPVPVWRQRAARLVSLLAVGASPVPATGLRSAARPVRPARRGVPSGRRPTAAGEPGGIHAAGRVAGRVRTGTRRRTGRARQRRASRQGARHGRALERQRDVGPRGGAARRTAQRAAA